MSKRVNPKTDWLEEEVGNLKRQGLFNKIKTVESPMSGRIVVDGKKVLNFCSNNYLGLANHPQLKKATKKAIDKYGIGPTAVRTIAGTTKLHNQLEERLAKFKKVQAVITMQSGFAANTATIPAIVGEKDVIFSDELNHASIIDGCRLSRAKVIRYKHMDTSDLEKKVKGYQKASQQGRQRSPASSSEAGRAKVKKLIVTDGVFSMDGDIAPLKNLQKIAEKYSALLMVDDAHGEGVLGKNGRGIVNHLGLHGKVDIEIGTMSKAFGVVGGYVAGKRVLIDWLKQRARPFLFSSAMTIPDTAACIEAVKILTKSEKLVKKLWENTSYLKSKLNELGFNIGNSQTPIIPVMLGDAKLAQTFSKKTI